MQLTTNFTREELQCKCGCGKMEIPMASINRLQKLRDMVGFALPITSGYRCPDHNARVSGTGRTGPHTKGAFDIGVSHHQAYMVLAAAIAVGFTGIGVNQKGTGRFIHVDDLPESDLRPTVWSY